MTQTIFHQGGGDGGGGGGRGYSGFYVTGTIEGFTTTLTFSHPPNFALQCFNIFLSLPSHVLTSRKSAIRGLPVRNQSSRLILWCYMLFTVPLFFLQDRRERALKAATLTEFSLNYLRGAGAVLEPPGPPSRYIYKMSSRAMSTILQNTREL